LFESADSYADFIMSLLEGDEWAPNIRDPHEYLVKEMPPPLPPGKSHTELSEAAVHELRRLGLPTEDASHKQSILRCEFFIWRCVDLITQRLPEDQRQRVTQSLAFRGAKNFRSSASTYRSPEHYYAIVVSSDLVTLLYLYAAFYEAITHPQNVEFCSIDPDNPRLDSQSYLVNLAHILDIVRDRGLTPVVIFLFNDQGARMVSSFFDAMLSFVISHELHHFLSGELTEPGKFSIERSDIGVPKFNETQASELGADIAAFEFMKSRYMPRFAPETGPDFLPFCVYAFFELLTKIGFSTTATHPHPFERFIHICRICIPPIPGNETVWSELVPAAVQYLHDSDA